jgi:hypothetical protein
MNEKKPTSSWDDLITQIGAKPPADALERKRPAIETTFEPPAVADPAAVRPKPGDWNALADQLGVDVPPEEPAPKPRASTESAGPSSSMLEARLAEIEPIESDFEPIVDEDIEFEEVDDEDDESEMMGEVGSDAEVEDSQSLSGDAARSAFEALFNAGSFSALPPLKKPAPREPERSRGGPQWRDPDAPRERRVERESAFDDLDDSAESALEEDVEESATKGEEGDRPRRRRRRRRGRGRDEVRGERSEKSGNEAAAPGESTEGWEEASDGEFGEEDAADSGPEGEDRAEGDNEDRPVRRRRRRRRRSSRPGEAETRVGEGAEATSDADGDEEDDDHDDEEAAAPRQAAGHDDDDDDDDDDDLPRESHKNIPTWSDAISVMVETNLQSRKNSPSRPAAPRGRGRGRGRGGSSSGGGGRRGPS